MTENLALEPAPMSSVISALTYKKVLMTEDRIASASVASLGPRGDPNNRSHRLGADDLDLSCPLVPLHPIIDTATSNSHGVGLPGAQGMDGAASSSEAEQGEAEIGGAAQQINITRQPGLRRPWSHPLPVIKTRVSSAEDQPPNRHAERGVSALMTGRSPPRKTMAGHQGQCLGSTKPGGRTARRATS